MNGRPTPKSKITDLVPRVAVAIHNLEQTFACLSENAEFVFNEEIQIATLHRAIYLVDIMEQQKDMFSTVHQLAIAFFQFNCQTELNRIYAIFL